jgi:hypothetical protein
MPNTKYGQVGRSLTLPKPAYPPTYSVCTLVTRPDEYREMCESFIARGFSPEDTEYLYVDNSAGTTADAYQAYNLFLTEAKSPYIILCHQDILLLEDGRQKLDSIIADLNSRDPGWGLLGNSGPQEDGRLVTRISDPYEKDRTLHGPFPAKVLNLDENFIVARRSANLSLSHNLSGFHLYGPDLCLIADILGVSAYVVDFHLLHKSGGSKDKTYYDVRRAFQNKYRHAFRSRWLQIPTLCAVYLTGSPARSFAARLLRRAGLFRRYDAAAALGER